MGSLPDLSDYSIAYTTHSPIRLSQRSLSEAEINSFLNKEAPLLAREQEQNKWELIYRRSSKYYLKVVININMPTKNLFVITAHILNKKKAQKVHKKWLR